MKKALMLIAMLSIALVIHSEEPFTKGCSLYQAHKFQAALNTWMEVTPKSYQVWFNAGAAASQLGNSIDAAVYWLRAWHSAPRSLRSQSMDYAKESLSQAGALEAFTQLWHENAATIIPLLWWQVIVLLLLFITGMAGKRLARKRQWYMLGTLVGVTGIAIAGLCISYYDAWYPRALIVKEQVSYYAGPDEQFEVLGSLPQGSIVKVLSRAQGWHKIRINNNQGWAVGTTMALVDGES